MEVELIHDVPTWVSDVDVFTARMYTKIIHELKKSKFFYSILAQTFQAVVCREATTLLFYICSDLSWNKWTL